MDDYRSLPPEHAPLCTTVDDPVDDPISGARAGVLARLWGALAREPIPGVHSRGGAAQLTLTLPGGGELTGPAAAAEPFAPGRPGLSVTFDGRPYDDPGRLLAALPLPVPTARLVAELDNSVANLALARAAQPPPQGGPPMLARPDVTLAELEQCVVDGHPLHPCCRTRIGMSPEEVRAYAPEHHPVVQVELVQVPTDRWLSTGEGLPPLLPVHPWQRDHVLDRYPWLRLTGERVPARPLMSLRTVVPATAPDRHWKTAVDVQMTSAVRTVSPGAVRNGPAVSDLVAAVAGRDPGLAGDGTFTMLREVAAGAVVVDGEPCRSLAVAIREAPRRRAIPLASLAAPSPADGRPLATEAVSLGYAGDPVAYFADLCRIVLPPLLTLLQAGIALEAHGQNTLVGLRGGRLTGLLYRDLGGVRISPARLRASGVDPPPLHGDLRSDDPAVLRTKLFAAVVSGALAEQAAVLGRVYGTPRELLWAQAASAAKDTYRRLPGGAGGDAKALFDAVLPVKATTAMRLAADPLADIWTWLPNPLAGLW
jgi:siderophore synthetase component